MYAKPALARVASGLLAVPKGVSLLYSADGVERVGLVVGHYYEDSVVVAYQILRASGVSRVDATGVIREVRDIRNEARPRPEHIDSLWEFTRLCRMTRAVVVRHEDTLTATIGGVSAMYHICQSDARAAYCLKALSAMAARLKVADPAPIRRPHPSYQWAVSPL